MPCRFASSGTVATSRSASRAILALNVASNFLRDLVISVLHRLRQSRTLHTLTFGPISGVHFRQRGCGHRVAYPATANLNELPDSVHSLCPRFRLQPELDQAADGFTDDGARLPAPATWWRVGLTQRCYSPFTEMEGPPGRKERQISLAFVAKLSLGQVKFTFVHFGWNEIPISAWCFWLAV